MGLLVLLYVNGYESIIIGRDSKVWGCEVDMQWNLSSCNKIESTMGNPIMVIRDTRMQVYFVDYLKNDFVEVSYLIKYQLKIVNGSYTIANKTLVYRGNHITGLGRDSYDNIYFAEKVGVIGRVDPNTGVLMQLYSFMFSSSVASLSSIHLDLYNDVLLWSNLENNHSVASKAFILPFVVQEPIEFCPPFLFKGARAITSILDTIYLLSNDGYIYSFITHFGPNPQKSNIQIKSNVLKSFGPYLLYIDIDTGDVSIQDTTNSQNFTISGISTIVGGAVDININSY